MHMQLKIVDLIKMNNSRFCFIIQGELSIENIFKELSDEESIIYFLIKDDVLELFYRTKGYIPTELTGLIDSILNNAIEATARQTKKAKNKDNVFFLKEPISIETILKYVIQRVTNNLRTILMKKDEFKYYYNLLILSDIYKYENNREVQAYLNEKDFEKIVQSDIDLVAKQINILLEDFTLTLSEVEYLFAKYKFTVPVNNAFEISDLVKFTKGSPNNNQSYLSFDDEDCA